MHVAFRHEAGADGVVQIPHGGGLVRSVTTLVCLIRYGVISLSSGLSAPTAAMNSPAREWYASRNGLLAGVHVTTMSAPASAVSSEGGEDLELSRSDQFASAAIACRLVDMPHVHSFQRPYNSQGLDGRVPQRATADQRCGSRIIASQVPGRRTQGRDQARIEDPERCAAIEIHHDDHALDGGEIVCGGVRRKVGVDLRCKHVPACRLYMEGAAFRTDTRLSDSGGDPVA